MTQATQSAAEREIVLTRVVEAPRDLVFTAYTEPQHVSRWWGPNGFSTTTHEMDVRPGGVWRFTMTHAEYGTFPNLIVYREVVRPERLVYDHGADEHDEGTFHVTITFEDEGGKTRVTQTSVFNTAEQRAEVIKFGAVELGMQTLEKLAAYLPTM